MNRYLPWLVLACLTAHGREEVHELAPTALRIPRGKSLTLEFGTLPQKDHTILLDILSRLDADGLGGSLYFMKLELNGRDVAAARSRTVHRLVNKAPVSPVAPGTPFSWSQKNTWRVLYSPDFESALKQKFYEGNPYQTVLDVTDLTNPAAENRLTITNTCGYQPPAGSRANYDLVIQPLTVRVKPGASPTMAACEQAAPVINRGTPGAGPAAYRGALLAGGGFELVIANQRFAFSSAVSYPNAGLNRLAAASAPIAEHQPGWNLRVQTSPSGGTVVGEGPDYRLERHVTFGPRKVTVVDTFTNRHAEAKLGLLVEQSLDLKDKPAALVRLAGNPDPALNTYHSHGNPSVFVNLGDVSLGLLCEDDVFRNQATLFCDSTSGATGLRTTHLCLPPQGSYSLEWSVYPVASRDYYDFINLVRRDWGSNYTVEGAWTFFDPDSILSLPVEEIRNRFQKLGIKRACYCGGWVDRKHDPKRIGFGTGVLDGYWADFRDRLSRAAARIREAVPDCKVYVYYDSQRDTSEGGQERFRDSWLTNPAGQQLSTGWGGRYSLTRSMVATLENRFGKAMLQAVDHYLREMKTNGLYWDEMECVGYGAPLITYHTWDGYSCELDPNTYTIRRECGITTLLGESHRMAVIRRVRELGGDLMGNGPTATKDLLKLRPQRMVEIQHNDNWHYEGNLDSPLGYASSRLDFGNWIRALNFATLLVGTRYTYEHEISSHVFPFTPIELHAGYLLGQERIITVHSGTFGWPGERCLIQPRWFDAAGKLVAKPVTTTIGTEARTKLELTEGEAAVLVKLPVTLHPRAGSATVSQIDFSPGRFACTVLAPEGAVLLLNPKPMGWSTSTACPAALSGSPVPLVACPGGLLQMDLPPAPESRPVAITCR